MSKVRECSDCKYDITILNEDGLDCESLGKEHKWHDVDVFDNMCCECGKSGEYWLK